jgi:hypothetical protein
MRKKEVSIVGLIKNKSNFIFSANKAADAYLLEDFLEIVLKSLQVQQAT